MREQNFTFHVNLYSYQHVYDAESLKNYLDWSLRDIQRMEETIEKVKEYQRAVNQHLNLVSSIETVPEVNLQRSVSYKGKVDYFVFVKHVPQVEVEEGKRNLYIKSTENKKFEGKERHLASKYAEELAKKYECEIKKVGFKK